MAAIALLLLGLTAGVLLSFIIWSIVTNHGERKWPRLICRWER